MNNIYTHTHCYIATFCFTRMMPIQCLQSSRSVNSLVWCICFASQYKEFAFAFHALMMLHKVQSDLKVPVQL
jgi:hypothetical protein